MKRKRMKQAFLYILSMALLGTGLIMCRQEVEEGRLEIAYSETTPYPNPHKHVLILSGSPRKGGNTDLLCDAFADGVRDAGGSVEKIFLNDYRIDYFSEADVQRTGERAHEATDDAPRIVDKMVEADVIVLASPVYYMNMTGQMKTFIDRTFGRYREMKNKEFYYLTACADPFDSTADWCIRAFRGFVLCLPNPVERGMVMATGMGRKGAVKGSSYEKEAYLLGTRINAQ